MPVLSKSEIDELFPHPISRVKISWLYVGGLAGVVLALVLLQLIYLALVGAFAYATYRYLLFLPVMLADMNINFFTLVLIFGPPAVGIITTFFLFKPLLSRRPKEEEALTLSETDAPTLHAFVRRLCTVLRAPMPSRIEVDLQVNASARLRRPWLSLVTSDLSLRIGLPLVAGMNVRQLSGVLAHEFGHFTQRLGMRLYFLIESIRYWFARVAYERDQWDEWLEETQRGGGWRTKLILAIASGTVYVSRALLRGLFHAGNWVSAWFSRQMEFDADRVQAALVGGGTVEEVLREIRVLSGSAESAWTTMSRGWHQRRVGDDYIPVLRYRNAAVTEEDRARVAEYAREEEAERGSTHPTFLQRVENVKGMEGILPAGAARWAEAPAECLFEDFEGVCRKATQLHLQRSVGEELAAAAMLPAAEFLEERRVEDRWRDAMAQTFPLLTMPSRWFQLPEGPLEGDTIRVYLTGEDETAKYWKLLEESLNRNGGLEFLRAGGRIDPLSFSLSDARLEVAEKEAAESRQALREEMARLREQYRSYGYLISQEQSEVRAAYLALSDEQEKLIEVRHAWVALRVMKQNTKFLPDNGGELIQEREGRLWALADGVLERWEAVPAPELDGMAEAETLRALLATGADRESMSVEDFVAQMLERADEAAERLLGELCARGIEKRAPAAVDS